MDAPVSGRGQGKVILLGEHAVVHGVPALAAALSHGATATATTSDRDRDRLRIASWNVDLSPDDDLPLARAFAAAIAARDRRGAIAVRLPVRRSPPIGFPTSRASPNVPSRSSRIWNASPSGPPKRSSAASCASVGSPSSAPRRSGPETV